MPSALTQGPTAPDTRGLPQVHTALRGPGEKPCVPPHQGPPHTAGQEVVPFPKAEVTATARSVPLLRWISREEQNTSNSQQLLTAYWHEGHE